MRSLNRLNREPDTAFAEQPDHVEKTAFPESAYSICRACSPDRSRRRCSAISAPRSSRSSAPAPATTRAEWVRRSSRTRRAATRASRRSFSAANRNKKSITLNLAAPEGQDIVRRLAAISDVVVENFKVGDLKRYGLDHESLRKINPRLVYCSVTGFGQTGPYAPRPGYDSIFQGNGRPDERHRLSGRRRRRAGQDRTVDRRLHRRPVRRDRRASPRCTSAMRTASHSGGGGQHVDIALLDSVIASLSHYTAQYLATGEVPVRRGTQGNGGLPSQMFPCADGAVMVVCGNDEQYRRFCAVLKPPELADDRTFRHQPAARAQPQAAGADLRCDHEAMEAAGHCSTPWRRPTCRPARSTTCEQVFDDPQVRHRGMAVEVPHPLAGTVKIYANPIRLSETPIDHYTAPPTMGQHTGRGVQRSARSG